MSTGLWIAIGLAIAAVLFFASRRSGASSTGSADLGAQFEKADALALELARECVALAKALPVLDEQTSWLLHEPLYDARTDSFDPPCAEQEFAYSSGHCWKTFDDLGEVFWRWTENEARFRLGLVRPRTDCVIPAADHVDIVSCSHSVNEPGLQIVRLCRVAENRWHTHLWSCGFGATAAVIAVGNSRITLASDSGQLDPPLLARDVAQDPSLWTQRNDLVRARWSTDRNWREAVALCKHRAAD